MGGPCADDKARATHLSRAKTRHQHTHTYTLVHTHTEGTIKPSIHLHLKGYLFRVIVASDEGRGGGRDIEGLLK